MVELGGLGSVAGHVVLDCAVSMVSLFFSCSLGSVGCLGSGVLSSLHCSLGIYLVLVVWYLS